VIVVAPTGKLADPVSVPLVAVTVVVPGVMSTNEVRATPFEAGAGLIVQESLPHSGSLVLKVTFPDQPVQIVFELLAALALKKVRELPSTWPD
jgi:hypothetical protein